MKLLRFPFFMLVALLFSPSLSAQNAGMSLIVASPQNEFKDNVKNTGFGIGMEGIYYFGNSSIPFGVGLNIGFINYGSEHLNRPLSTTLPGVTVNLDRTNNLANFHLLFQLTTRTTTVRPYLDLLFGLNYLFTESKVTDEGQGNDIATSRNISDYAWSYGFGGGLMFNIYTPNPDEMSEFGALFLDLKVRYLKGTEAEYLTEGSIVGNPDGTVTLLTSKSKTDLLQVQVGVMAKFNSFLF